MRLKLVINGKSILILFLVSLNIFKVFSQSLINGNLKSESGNPVSGVSITLTELYSDNILKYDISDSKGFFSISVNSKSKLLKLNIRSMGYKSVAKIIDNKDQTLNLVLEEEITTLKEVIVKQNSITKRGDTINYSVNAFVKKEDRTIGDVLKNMPGIEVSGDGRIRYQGKPINKYYIEGLDLLEGKYNLANENLSYEDVARVQVLENHQPIRLLDSLVFSDQAAINIKLKKAYTFSGQAQLGVGLTPLLWDVNITPMLFSKKEQMLSSYQSNNTGDNVSKQLKTLTIDKLVDQFELNDQKKDWLSLQKLQSPNFSETRWLDNNIHLVTSNYLRRIKKDYELRLNMSYLNDYQQQLGATDTRFFTPTDTIALFENKYNQLYLNSFESNLTLQKNTTNNYLKNSLVFQGFWDSARGSIDLSNSKVSQDLSNRYFKISNDFKTLFPLGKQITMLTSYVGLYKTPQSLEVEPGQFQDLLNNGVPYQRVNQNLELKTFYTNNSVGFTKGLGLFSVSPKLGFQFEKQRLSSEIETSNLEQLDFFENNLNWERYKLYAQVQTQFKKQRWTFNLSTPLNIQGYKISDKPLQRYQNFNRVTFEPRASIRLDVSSFWNLGLSGSVSNRFGAINQLYYNYILRNYRNIQRIDAPLPESQNISCSAKIGYRNPIRALFFNFIYSNALSNNNLLYNNLILENGAQEMQAVIQDNKRLSHNFSSRISKYFSNLNTNASLSVNYNLSNFKQILNFEVTNIANENWRFNGKVDVDVTEWVNAEVKSSFQFSKNSIQNRSNQTISQQSHQLHLNIYPSDKQYIGFKTEYVFTDVFSENASNFFADIQYRFSFNKKIDVELRWNNVFNTKEYITVNVDEFSYVGTNFQLRPSQLLLSVRFSL